MKTLGAKGWGAIVAAVGGVVVAGAALISVEPGPPIRPIHPAAALAAAPTPSPKPAPVDERFVIKRVLPITGPIKYGEWHWDGAGVPDGPLVMTVDLEARVLSVFRGGYEIAATAVLLGTSEKPTPLGVFPINWKSADHHSRTYDNAPMPFTMNLTVDGVSIHGTKVENGYASHGCIGVPTPFAQKLFALAKVGDKVYITRGKQTGVGQSLTES
ncbi:MAG: L,D-transpeptidase family protein [Novosphingobium sp.]